MKRPAKRSISQRIRSLSLFLVLSTAMMGMTTTLLFSLRMEYQSMDRNLMNSAQVLAQSPQVRSEERRVGKECRSRWSPYH